MGQWEPRDTESFIRDVNRLIKRQERRLVATKGLAAGLQEDIGLVDTEVQEARVALAAAQLELDGAQLDLDQAFLQIGTAQFTADGASAQAGTALSKADAAIVAAGDAADDAGDAAEAAQAADAKAVQAIADALSAANIANNKGKVIYQVSKPTGSNAVAGNLWVRSSDGKTFAYDASIPDWVAVTDPQVIAAAAQAAQAIQDAAAAKAAATAAQSAADSKPLILFGTTDPSGTAPKGSTWFKIDGQGNIGGQWQQTAAGTASTWTVRPISSEVIANLDVGKLTVGTALIANAVLQKIAAGTANIQTANIANLFVTQGATMAQATIEALFTQVVRAHQITADMIDVNTLNGVTLVGTIIKSAASGKRIEIQGQRIDVYGATGASAASIEGFADTATSSIVQITGTNNGGTARAGFGGPVQYPIKNGDGQQFTVNADMGKGATAPVVAATRLYAWDPAGLTGALVVDGSDLDNIVVRASKFVRNDDTGWINLPTTAGTVDSSFPPQYRRVGGWVSLRGNIAPTSTLQTVANLPAGFRPGVAIEAACVRGTGSTATPSFWDVRLQAGGNLALMGPSGGSSSINLGGFPAFLADN